MYFELIQQIRMRGFKDTYTSKSNQPNLTLDMTIKILQTTSSLLILFCMVNSVNYQVE